MNILNINHTSPRFNSFPYRQSLFLLITVPRDSNLNISTELNDNALSQIQKDHSLICKLKTQKKGIKYNKKKKQLSRKISLYMSKIFISGDTFQTETFFFSRQRKSADLFCSPLSHMIPLFLLAFIRIPYLNIFFGSTLSLFGGSLKAPPAIFQDTRDKSGKTIVAVDEYSVSHSLEYFHFLPLVFFFLSLSLSRFRFHCSAWHNFHASSETVCILSFCANIYVNISGSAKVRFFFHLNFFITKHSNSFF